MQTQTQIQTQPPAQIFFGIVCNTLAKMGFSEKEQTSIIDLAIELCPTRIIDNEEIFRHKTFEYAIHLIIKNNLY